MSAGILATASSMSTMRGLSPSPKLPSSEESRFTFVIVLCMHYCKFFLHFFFFF